MERNNHCNNTHTNTGAGGNTDTYSNAYTGTWRNTEAYPYAYVGTESNTNANNVYCYAKASSARI